MERPEATTEPAPIAPGMVVAALLALVALWLVTHPYEGIFHDARLYTLQALSRAHPGRYADDLFLAFGSQDRFSIFASLYAPALAAFGNGGGHLAVLVVCAALWVAAALYFARGWLADGAIGWPLAIGATAAAVAFPGGISFRYAEPFLTPRLPAEALTLLALALAVRGRTLPALLALGTALAIHPLMAIPGVALWFLMECRHRPWLWLLAAAGIGLAAVLAGLGVEPFARLGQRFDPAWLAIVTSRNPQCLISQWGDTEWTAAANGFGAAAIAWSFGNARTRPLIGAAIAVGAIGIAVGWIGGDLLHNILLTDIQAWRWTWLTAAVAHLGIGALLVDVARGKTRLTMPELLLLLVVVVMLAVSRYSYPAGALLAPIMLALAALHHWRERTGRPAARWAIILVAYLTVQLLVLAAGALRGLPAPGVATLVGAGLCLVLLAGIIAVAAGRMRGQVAVLVPALVAVAVAAAYWDQRTPWRGHVDSVAAPPADLVALLPAGSLYWEGDMTALWLMLQRPSYFSCDQGAGVLFARGTAIAYAARAESLARLRPLDFRQYDFCPMPAGAPRRPRSVADLADVCRREPELAGVVLASPVAGAAGRTWTPPVRFELPLAGGHRFSSNRFHIYACAAFR
ncbi:MAG: hypothetical protein DCF31_00010 [Alphaproteobacteria bacterium]|nr:MAG: hypothetical protein DCF31_00010 [Alphaproteobacteria bacterium]